MYYTNPMRRFALPSLGVTVLLAGSLALVSPAAYASPSATAPQTLAVQPGTLFVSNTTPANITAPVDGSGSGNLPTALWGDTTGTGDGWQGSIAASNFVYTGQWTPIGSAPALESSSSASYTGSADGDTYTVSVTGVSGSTISFSYSSQNGATGTGTATAGTAANVGTNGLTITFSSSTTYSTGDEYQIQVGSQNKNALTLADGGSPASVAPYQGTTSTAPTFVNQTAAVTGGGSTYGTAVYILSAPTYTGMGEYTVTPAATVNTDINSWAATYTGQIQYTISSGPYASNSTTPSASTSQSNSTSPSNSTTTPNYTNTPLLANPEVITTVGTVSQDTAIAASTSTIYSSSYNSDSTTALNASNAQSVANYTTHNIYDSVYYQGNLWGTNYPGETVYKINPSNGNTEASLSLGTNAFAITSGDGYIWATTDGNGDVYKIDPSNDTLAGTYAVSYSPLYGITYSNGDLWVTDFDSDSVTEINASTGAVIQSVSVGSEPIGITTGGGYVWVANYGSNTVTQINQTTGDVVHTITVGFGPSDIAYTGGAAWVTNETSDTVFEITSNGSVAAALPVGSYPYYIVADNGYLWVANRVSGTVTEIES